MQYLGSSIYAILKVKLMNICATFGIKYICNTQGEFYKMKWMFVQHMSSSICVILEVNLFKFSRYLCTIWDQVFAQYSR